MLGARLVEAVLNMHLFGNIVKVVIYLESLYFKSMPHEDFPEVTKQTTEMIAICMGTTQNFRPFSPQVCPISSS